MQWLPDTIDALTRMLAEAGVVGSVAFLLAITMALLLWKHLGQILEVAKAQLSVKKDADTAVIGLLQDISKTNSSIMQSNANIMDRVDKLPSDKVVCKAHTTVELAELLKTLMGKIGVNLSDEEAEIVIRQRIASKSGEIPIPKPK